MVVILMAVPILARRPAAAEVGGGARHRFDAPGGPPTRIGTHTTTPVPEPSALAAVGLSAVAVLRRRRRA